MFGRRILALIVTLSLVAPSASFAQTKEPAARTCDDIWARNKNRIRDLEKVADCGSGVTALECRENMGSYAGLLGLGAAAGAAAGGVAYKNRKKVCGLGGFGAFWFESVAYAADCLKREAALAMDVAHAVQLGQEIREAETGHRMVERLRAEDPHLTRQAERLQQLYEGLGSSGDDGAHKEMVEIADDLEKRYGIKFKRETFATRGIRRISVMDTFQARQFSSETDIHRKLAALMTASRGLAGSVDMDGMRGGRYQQALWQMNRLYPGDQDLYEMESSNRSAKSLIDRIKKGGVKNADELAKVLDEAIDKASPAVAQQLATIAERAKQHFPAKSGEFVRIAGRAREKHATGFTKSMAGGAKNIPKPKFLKAIVPGGLLAAAGVASAATPQQGLEDLVTGTLLTTTTQVGCAMRSSEYVTIDASTCKPVIDMDTGARAYFELPMTQKKKELCANPTIEDLIKGLHEKHFGVATKGKCQSNVVVLDNKKTETYARAVFDENDHVKSYTYMQSNGSIKRVQLEFDDGGTVKDGHFVNSRSDRTSIDQPFLQGKKSPEDLETVLESFSDHQVLLNMGRACCSGKLDWTECSRFEGAADAGGKSERFTD